MHTSRRTARDWAVDALMFAVAVGLSAFVVADTWSQHSELGKAVDVLLGVPALAALWWRRRYPVALGVPVTVASGFALLASGPWLCFTFNAAIRAPRRALIALVALSVFPAAVAPAIYPGSQGPWLGQVALCALATGVAVGWGLFVRARRQLERQQRERAARAVEEARDAERRRIATEMHDVLAHRLSLLAVHAGALEFRLDATPEEVGHAAGVIRTSAQAALTELRDVIGLLREDHGGEAPQPALDAIPALIEESRAAGMDVRAQVDVSGGGELVGRTAYRVVQEGLTNARKHAPDAAVDVTVSAPNGRLVVEVHSRPGTPEPAPLVGAGTGLIGLAERVELAGGELVHGRDPAGDFRLRATLPWAP